MNTSYLSWLIAIACLPMTGQTAPAAIIPFPLPEGDESNPHFNVRVNGVPIPACTTAMKVGYAHFAFAGKATVEITASEPIGTFDVSPHRAGITAKANDRTLSFDLASPVKLHIEINKLPRFFLFAESPEIAEAPSNAVSIAEFGVTGSAESVQTGAFQRAMDAVAARKGVLLVPPGIYRAGELRMPSHLTLHLMPGAILKGTGEVKDHPAGEFGTQFISFLECEQARIQGGGVIDAQGRALRLSDSNSSASRCKLIRAVRARDIVIENVVLRDSGTWAAHLIESENLRFSGVKLISNTIHDDPDFPWESNTDGFDPDNSSQVLIENSFISCNDDAIAVKLRYGARRDMSGIRFSGNVVWTVKSALKIGTEVYEKRLSDVLFENNEVIRADRGIALYCNSGGTVENARWINNHFQFIGGDTKRMLLEIKVKNEKGKGLVRDLIIRDNTFENQAENPSLIEGLEPGHEVRGVRFQNLVVGGQRCLSAAAAKVRISRHAEEVTFE